MPFGYLAAATIGGALIGSNAAKEAAGIQSQGARDAAAVQKQMFDVQNEQQKPYREAGYSALSDIGAMKPYLTNQFTAEDFKANMDPGYAWRLAQGQQQAERQANMAGGAVSGNTLAALQDYTQGQASQEYGNAFNRYQTQRSNIYNTLASIAGLGQTSLGQSTQAGTQAAGNIGSAMQNAASAQAAGQVGSANAIGGGLQSLGNTYMLSQLLKPQMATPAGYGTPVAQPLNLSIG